MAVKSKALGRGLGALLDVSDTTPKTDIDINKIDLDKTQPRKNFDQDKLEELAQSVATHGIISPLILVEKNGRYRIVAGERRYRAARIAGLSTVPAVIRDFDEKQILEISIIENIQREDLNPIEEAEAISRLMKEHGYTQDNVAERLGRSRSAVANSLRLLGLPKSVRSLVIDEKLSQGHARALLSLKDHALMASAADHVIDKKMSVRETEEYVKRLMTEKPVKKAVMRDPEMISAEKTIGEKLDTKVSISGNGKRGKITLEYYSAEHLDALYELLTSK